MKYLVPLLIVTNNLLVQGLLEWTIIGKVTEYGQNVTLFCKVPNCCPEDSGWDRWTPQQRTLFIDVKTGRSNKKYDGKILKNGYTLVIQNLTKDDLNVSYSCLYGVTFGERKFLLKEDAFKSISTRSDDYNRLSQGEITALTIGVIVVLAVAVTISVYFWKRRKKRNDRDSEETLLMHVIDDNGQLSPTLPASIGSIEEYNFLRIVYLSYRVANGALKKFFERQQPDFPAKLNIQANKAILNQLFKPVDGKRRKLDQTQWNTLYPQQGTLESISGDLDVTLIIFLLSHLPPVVEAPVNGFDKLPTPNEESDGANIARLKYYQQFLVSHSTISNEEFVRIWNTLEQAIKGLDNSQATAVNLKNAKTNILDLALVKLLSTQAKLYKKVSSLEDELEDISKCLNKDVQDKKELKLITENIDERTKIKGDHLEREVILHEDSVDRLSERQNISEERLCKRAERIIKQIDYLSTLKKCLASKFNTVETIVKDGKKEAEDYFVKDVQSLCSQIQDDISKHEERIDALVKKTETLQEVQKDVNSIKKQLEIKMKKHDEDHIPMNIRAQHEQEIREWEQDQTTFLETRATHHILDALHSDDCIVVTGSSGCGKSSNIHHAALHLRDRFGYEIIPVLTGPTDIINYYNERQRQVFVVDDISGKETLNTQTLQMWRDYSEKIEKILKDKKKNIVNTNNETILKSKISDSKLLISCRLHIYKESEFQRITLLTKKECNLLSNELRLQPKERMCMLHKYLTNDIIDNLTQDIMNDEFFPLLCKLSKGKPSEEVRKLFTAPLQSIKESLKNIFNENKAQCCALVVCILFENGFNTDWLKSKLAPEMKEKLADIVVEFGIHLNRETSRNSLEEQVNILTGTYLKQRNTEYRLIHDKIYKMTAVIYGQHIPECFIKYASSIFIRDHFIFESLTEARQCENDDLIVLSKYKEEYYFKRLVRDLDSNVITSTFHNNQLIYKPFIHKLVNFFKTDSHAQKVLKKLDTEGCIMTRDAHKATHSFDTQFNTTPLIESASNGYFAIVQFLIVEIGCNVNNIIIRRRPLDAACYRGHTDIVKLLLEYNADVSQRDINGQSPLLLACKRQNTEIVKLLLQYNADVSMCDSRGMLPLFCACEMGNINIVQLLLQYNADASQCSTRYGSSPLYVACKGGHTGIVKLLLQKNADVSRCVTGTSPLYVACKGGHTGIVKLLLQKNADVFQCDIYDGTSPLYAACKGGHTDIVELLLHSKADISQCNNEGESPLLVACKRRTIDMVGLLLQNQADIHQCDNNGDSPLYVSCKGGQTEIVKLLLKNNANASYITPAGQSLLFVACERGYTDLVFLLLQYNADISHSTSGGEPPLYVACKSGHTEIVKLLMQYKADVNQCNSWEQFPLNVACAGGYTDVVNLLLQNNADSSMSNRLGEFPLYVACENQHTDTVKLLLQNNAFVSQCNNDGRSALHVACKLNFIDIVKLLLQYKADLSLCDSMGQSPLLVACLARRTGDIVKLLLQNRADVSMCDNKGQSPMLVSCLAGRIRYVKLLIQNNADVSQCNTLNESPLYVACKQGNTATVKLLLENNASVDQCETHDGKSPLHVACDIDSFKMLKVDPSSYRKRFSRHIETVKLLLAWNADARMCDNNDQTPLHIARRSKCMEIVNLLEKNLQ